MNMNKKNLAQSIALLAAATIGTVTGVAAQAQEAPLGGIENLARSTSIVNNEPTPNGYKPLGGQEQFPRVDAVIDGDDYMIWQLSRIRERQSVVIDGVRSAKGEAPRRR